jgi:hypothetical protein
MPSSIKPESPLILEEILLLWGYEVYFKDDNVCSLVPKDKNSKGRPISISQKPGPNGLSVQIIEHALFEARLDSFQYLKLLEKVRAQQNARQAGQTKNL